MCQDPNRLPTTRCENDTICHAFLSSFTVYRHEKKRDVFGVSRPLRPRHTKNRHVVFACFSLKFYRLRRSRRRLTVKYQRKACKNDAAVLGVSRPLVMLVTSHHAKHVLYYEYLTQTRIKHINESTDA